MNILGIFDRCENRAPLLPSRQRVALAKLRLLPFAPIAVQVSKALPHARSALKHDLMRHEDCIFRAAKVRPSEHREPRPVGRAGQHARHHGYAEAKYLLTIIGPS